MTQFRPRFNDYRSREQIEREKRQAEQWRQDQVFHDRVHKRREAYEVLVAQLPLLEKHVEKSPVDVTYFSRLKSFFQSGLVGGWPVSSLYVPGSGDSESYHGPVPARTDYFIITEDKRFGYAYADEESNVFRLSDPSQFTVAGFLAYDYRYTRGPKGVIGVPSAEKIQQVVGELLAESGVRFTED